jgi:hypothetical protein
VRAALDTAWPGRPARAATLRPAVLLHSKQGHAGQEQGPAVRGLSTCGQGSQGSQGWLRRRSGLLTMRATFRTWPVGRCADRATRRRPVRSESRRRVRRAAGEGWRGVRSGGEKKGLCQRDRSAHACSTKGLRWFFVWLSVVWAPTTPGAHASCCRQCLCGKAAPRKRRGRRRAGGRAAAAAAGLRAGGAPIAREGVWAVGGSGQRRINLRHVGAAAGQLGDQPPGSGEV